MTTVMKVFTVLFLALVLLVGGANYSSSLPVCDGGYLGGLEPDDDFEWPGDCLIYCGSSSAPCIRLGPSVDQPEEGDPYYAEAEFADDDEYEEKHWEGTILEIEYDDDGEVEEFVGSIDEMEKIEK